MKKFFKTILLMVCGIMLISNVLASGCKKVEVNDSDKNVEILVIEGGYAEKRAGGGYVNTWLNNLITEFQKTNPDITFSFSNKDLEYGGAETFLKAGPEVNTIDLFMGSEPVIKYALYGDRFLNGYDCIFENLDDVYNAEVTMDGEPIKIKDRMIKGFVDFYSLTGEDGQTHYWNYPWMAGPIGIVYNATKFAEYNISVPKTTDELFGVTCKQLKAKNETPFVTSLMNSYDSSLFKVWRNQYYGQEGMDNYYQCKAYNPDSGMVEYSPDAVKDIGELYIAQAMELYVGVREPEDPDYDKFNNNHKHMNTLTYTQAQAQLFLGNANMYVCGDWLETEMANVKTDYDFQYMKTPVLSGIIERTPSIPDDATLSKVIAYIDGDEGATLPSGVTENDLAIIREARQVEDLCTFQTAYIPAYATAKGAAKEFLKFCATDKAIQICLDATKGSSFPFKYNYENDQDRWNSYSNFKKSTYTMMNNAIAPVCQDQYRLQVFGHLQLNSTSYQISSAKLSSKNPKDRIKPEDYYQDRLSYFTMDVLSKALERAGLL